MLKADRVSYLYPQRQPKRGVQSISLELKPNERIALTGPSGSGKTTLMKLLYGLLSPDKGKVTFNNELLRGPHQKLIPGHDAMALVHQQDGVLEKYTVKENLDQLLRHLSQREQRKRINRLLRLVELYAVRHRKADELSGGQRQRLNIARALAREPEMLLLDEPFSQNDRVVQERLLAAILEFQSEWNFGLLYATHDPEEALKLSDRVVYLENGKLQQVASPEAMYFMPHSIEIARYFGSVNVFSKESVEEWFGAERLQQQYHIEDCVLVRPGSLKLNEKGESRAFCIRKIQFLGTLWKVELNAPEQTIMVFTQQVDGLAVGKSYKLELLPNPALLHAPS